MSWKPVVTMIFALPSIVIYLLFSFAKWNFDPSKWKESDRWLCVGLVLFLLMLTIGAYEKTLDYINKKQ